MRRRCNGKMNFVLSWPPEAATPQALLTGQIDLLMKDESGWRLFDYKTGRFPAKISDAELLAPYALQLGLYAIAAEKYLNQPLVSVGLIVLRPEVRSVDIPVDGPGTKFADIPRGRTLGGYFRLSRHGTSRPCRSISTSSARISAAGPSATTRPSSRTATRWQASSTNSRSCVAITSVAG